MKPFNLETALAGAPVIQRCGRPARIVGIAHELGETHRYYILGVEQELSGKWDYTGWYKSGMHMYPDKPSEADLFMAPTKKTLYCVLYKDASETAQISIRDSSSERDALIRANKYLHSDFKVIELFEKEYEE